MNGPVLVYCDASMGTTLAEAECNALAIDQNIDPEVLRQLDQKTNGSYRVVVATDSFAMRGIDYRAADVTMTLAIAKSFENQREAI
jgi:hypothetical protein